MTGPACKPAEAVHRGAPRCICHTAQNAVGHPIDKTIARDAGGAGVTADTVMMVGGLDALLVGQKGPPLPLVLPRHYHVVFCGCEGPRFQRFPGTVDGPVYS